MAANTAMCAGRQIGGVIAEEEQEALMIALDETDVRPAVIANVPANPGNVLGKIVEETLAEYDDTWGYVPQPQWV